MLPEEAIIKWNSAKPGVSHKAVTQRTCTATWSKSPIKTCK